MKRFFAAILCLCLLAGCGRTDSTGNTCRAKEGSGGGEVSGNTGETGADAGSELFRVIQSQDGAAPLLLAKESGGSGDVYTLSPTAVEPTLDGSSTAAMDLVYTPGTLLEITYGTVLETYPGQLGDVTAVNIRSDGFDDRCALYLRVLNDLWDTDGALNSDIAMISVDLSQTSLAESEQAAVAWAFGGEHGISEILTMSYQELAAEGYLSGTEPGAESLPHWEDGCLFTITERNSQDTAAVEKDGENSTGMDQDGLCALPRAGEKCGGTEHLPLPEQTQTGTAVPVENNERNGEKNTVTFDARKWRSALGAYFFADCTAEQALDGHWGDYTVGGQAIS